MRRSHGDPAGVRRLEPGDQPQQRALAATAAPDDGDKLARGNVQVEPAKNALGAIGFA